MWPFSRYLKKKFVTAIIESDKVSFSVFDIQCSTQLLFQHIPLRQLEVQSGIIFNQTAIKKIFKTFLQEHNVQDAFIALGLQGNIVQEHLVTIDKNNESPFDIAKKIAPSNIWNFHFLSRLSQGQQQVYFFSVAREIIMQYQLLALSIPFHCCLISSTLRALLELTQSVELADPVTLDELMHQRIDALEMMNILSPMIKSAEGKKLIALHTGLFLLGKQVINEKP